MTIWMFEERLTGEEVDVMCMVDHEMDEAMCALDCYPHLPTDFLYMAILQNWLARAAKELPPRDVAAMLTRARRELKDNFPEVKR